MKTKICIRTFLSTLIVLTFLLPAWSQVVVERSKDKVIISGTPYYIHIVKKGETAYSISKAYAITVEELIKENPPAVYGLNEGQALRIPVREVSENTQQQQTTPRTRRDEVKYIYHKLQPGETVYFLAKSYGVSENEIISSNPGIDITKLPVGAEIAVPKREFMTDRQEFAVQDSDHIFHKVVRGESLASIAEKYGLSVRELRKENRNIRFPQVGDYIRIPVVKAVQPIVNVAPAADTVKAVVEQPVVLWQRPSGYTPVRNLKGSFDVAVLLPFYLRENAVRTDIDSSKIVKGKPAYKIINRSEEWIYPRTIGFIEMYEGILLAVDTLRTLGMDVNLHVYDIKSDTLELTRLINRGNLAEMDLIIGPVYSHNLSIMASYADSLGIPVVSPVPLFNNTALINNPNLFVANSSIEVPQNTIAKKVSEYYDKNFVFIHADSAGVDPDVKTFKEKIINELSNRLPFEEIKFKEFLYYSRSAFDNDSINRLEHALSSKTDNIIIIASEEGPVISETLQEIHGLSRKFPVKVFGYPSLRGLENLEPKFIFDLDILIYSPYWIDYSRRDVKKFNDDFRQKFLTEPSELSYSWLGYDVAYYFLSGLAIHGKDFISHPEIHNPDLLETEFDFRRKSINDGFENQKLFPIRYTKDYEVKLETETSPGQ
ncbi:MAG: LysM peptidoglycan-binding domain-containing protein [Bacteroidia bacterium]|nr:LysM peptidoglycan-binding domain-containing protein [Bacteroidia bacterium]